MTISALTTDLSDTNMESHFEQHAYNDSDEFWDEVRDMISEFDIAFDEELIHLKERESEVAEPDRNVSVPTVNSTSVKVEARKRSPLKSPDDVEKETDEEPEEGQVSDDCEIVNVSKISDKERKKRIVITSSSSESSDSSPKRKHKQKKDKRRKDKKKTKKKHKHQSRSRSSSLEKMKEAIKKRLRESELLDEIERLEAEKRRRLKALSPDPEPYEPFKIAMPDLSFKPIPNPKPSTSKDVKITEAGFILKPVGKVGSRSRSKSFEPFIDGPMELVIPKDYPEDSNRWRRCEKRESPFRLKNRTFSPKRRSPSPRRRSPSPRRRSPSPRRRSPNPRRRSPSPLSRRRCISPLWKRRSPSPLKSRRSRDSSSRRSNRSPSPCSTSRAKSPKTRDKKGRSRSVSPRKVRNYRRREPSKESTLSSISEKSSVKSEKEKKLEKKSRREGKPSRWSTTTITTSIVPKVASDDENWDDIVDAAPKTEGAGYDLEEVKAAPKQLFKFLTVNTDVVKKKGSEGPKSKGARRRANKKNRTIRIDDDEEHIVMVGTGPTVPKPPKTVEEDWDLLLKPEIEPPSSYDMKEVLSLNPKSKRKKMPLFAPNGLVLDPIAPRVSVAKGTCSTTEEGELTSHSDGSQPLPPGCEPDEFLKPPSPPKKEAPLIMIPLPLQPPLPPIIPPPILPCQNKEDILLPPGVDEIEKDTVAAIPPLVKKYSEVKKLREMFDLMPPRCDDEDEFLPPPLTFLIPARPPVAEKKNPPKLVSATITIEDEPKEEVALRDNDKRKVKDVICVEDSEKESSVNGETTQKPETVPDTPVNVVTTSDTPAAVETPSEPVEEEETPPEEPPIPDVDPSKLLPYTLIKEKQDEDLIYSRIKETIYKDEPPSADIRYLMEEYKPMRITSSGLLYREKDDQTLIIIPESLIKETIASLHEIESDRHLNKVVTTERLTERYFWPFMFDTIHDFIANCPLCSGSP